jgi:hypothetical protein
MSDKFEIVAFHPEMGEATFTFEAEDECGAFSKFKFAVHNYWQWTVRTNIPVPVYPTSLRAQLDMDGTLER